MNKITNLKQWVVIGGGPAGVTYLTQLISNKISPDNIMWIDESFTGGAFDKYKDVPGNTKVKTFIHWASSNSMLKSLSEDGSSDPLKELRALDQEKSCSLGNIHKIMINYTNQLRKIIPSKQGKVLKLEFDPLSNFWKAFIFPTLPSNTKQDSQEKPSLDKCEVIISKNICMATGARPLGHTGLHLGLCGKQVIPFEKSLDLNFLKSNLKSGDILGIVGGSHSAFVIMYLIHSLNIPNIKIINFFKDEIRYAVYKKDFTLYDNTGLKGDIADWTISILEKGQKPNFKLTRISVSESDESLSQKIKECNKFVYAHGFGKCPIPQIIYRLPEAIGYEDKTEINPNISGFISNSNTNGSITVPSNTKGEIVVEGLYGFGFCFPEKVITRIGELEYNVGLAKFAGCADRWIKQTKL